MYDIISKRLAGSELRWSRHDAGCVPEGEPGRRAATALSLHEESGCEHEGKSTFQHWQSDR